MICKILLSVSKYSCLRFCSSSQCSSTFVVWCHDLSSCLDNLIVQVEGQGSIKEGILCMAWSPDHDLVLFVSAAGNLILMTCEFDHINETQILSQEFGEGEEKRCVGNDQAARIYLLSFVFPPLSHACFCWLGKERNSVSRILGKINSRYAEAKGMYLHAILLHAAQW